MEKHSMLGAGSLLAAGTRVPSGELWVGRPARKVRDLTPDDLAIIERSAAKVRSSMRKTKDVVFVMLCLIDFFLKINYCLVSIRFSIDTNNIQYL